MRKILFVNHEKCTGCELCVLNCSFQRTQAFSRSRAAIHVVKFDEEGICAPSMCLHCDEPFCVMICPVQALSKDEETGIVKQNTDVCIGCKRCMMVCPFGAPSVDPITGKVFKCNLCDGHPVCAESCPTGAIQYLKADRAAVIRKRESFKNLVSAMEFVSDESGKKRRKKTETEAHGG